MTATATHASRRWTILGWSLLAGGLVFAGFAAIGLVLLSPHYLKTHVERELSTRLGLDVTMETMSLSFRPRLRVSGTQLVFRVPAHPELPPFIAIDGLWVDVGLFSAMRNHVGTVHLQGAHITVPPGNARDGLPTSGSGGGKIVVDYLETRDAVLTLLRRDQSRDPLVFKIHRLDVNDVGFGRAMPFFAELTNPMPDGLVTSHGWIGPWQRGDPSGLPLSGSYTFALANLDTIRGIGGTLTSEGKYLGYLTKIAVEGTTSTPNFNLDLGGMPVPLATTFKAVVDGSDGSTTLEDVTATLFRTSLRVSGAIMNLPGPGRHDIALDVRIDDGRIEDLLRLAVNGHPFATGDVTMRARVLLPPGRGQVRDRLRVSGRFGLEHGRFTSGAVQAKLTELSRRSQGKDEGEQMSRVLTHLSGGFALTAGVMTLSGLSFAVPGAVVALDGTYGLVTTDLALSGTLRMQANMSAVVGGRKSIFIKPFDRLFRRSDAGTVVPIRITGTRSAPKVGVRMGAVLSRSAD